MTESAPPTPFQGGRYQILKKLGEGGKGIVYKALDTQLDRVVAIKVLKTEGLDDEALQRFRNEAQLAGRLTHANIVAVYDISTDGGRPFQVMELVDGQSLRGVLAGSNGALPFPRALDIARDVARALAYAHGKGVLHRDVKPENIMLTSDGTVKLMDFGLARAFDRPRLTAPGTMVGTPSYMAPENALGKESDERSDLYSLGAVIYEMVTGRPLFRSEDSLKLIYSHIHDEPALPSRVNPRLPVAVDHVLLRLLAKSPADRYASAGDVERALTALAKTQVSTAGRESGIARESPFSPAPDRPTPDTQRIATPEPGRSLPLIGRDAEVATLKGYVDDALRGDGLTVLIAGEAGIGKTRVSDEMEAYASLRGFRILSGRCTERERSAPYYPWIQMVRAFAREASIAEVARACGPYSADLAKLVPDIAEKVPAPPPSGSPDSPESQRLRMFDAVTRFFVEASQTRPILLDVSDLHSADPASLDLFQHVARGIHRHFVLLKGTYRDVEVEEGSPLARVLDDLHRERLTHAVVLKRLERPDVERMIAIAFDDPVTPDLLDKIYERTGGNPFFVEEVLRSLVEEGVVFRVGDRWERKPIAEVQIPSSVRAVVARRLERLDAETLTLLRIAAILGYEFTFEALVRTSEVEENRVVETIERALRHRLLQEQRLPAGRVVYRFTDPQVRDVLYDQMSAIRRRRYHRRAAEVLEGSAGPRAEEMAGELAHHYLLGGEVEKALHHSIRAARRAARVYAHEEAIGHCEMALELMEELRGSDGTLSREPLTERAHVLELLYQEASFPARWALAERSATEAARLFEEVGDRAAAGSNLLAAGSIRFWRFRSHEQGLAMMLKARDLVESEPESQLHAELCLALGAIATHLEFPQLPTDRALFEQALSLARATKAPGIEVVALTALASIEPLEDPEAARRDLGDALTLAHNLDLVEGPSVLWNVATARLFMEADLVGALSAIDEAIRWSRRTRNRGREMALEGTLLPFVWMVTGEIERAAAGAAIGARFSKEVGDPDALNHLIQAHIELTRGNLDRAASLIVTARQTQLGGSDWFDQAYDGYLEGWLEQERGNAARALTVLEAGISICERKRYPAVGAILWALLLGRAVDLSLRLPDAAEAERRTALYREQLERIADRIPVAPTRALALRARAAWELYRGDSEAAVHTLEEAVVCWRKVEWTYEMAATLYALGSAYQRSGDRFNAGRPLNEALEIFTRLKARRDIERVLGRKALLQA